jgi:hypothetical protein
MKILPFSFSPNGEMLSNLATLLRNHPFERACLPFIADRVETDFLFFTFFSGRKKTF